MTIFIIIVIIIIVLITTTTIAGIVNGTTIIAGGGGRVPLWNRGSMEKRLPLRFLFDRKKLRSIRRIQWWPVCFLSVSCEPVLLLYTPSIYEYIEIYIYIESCKWNSMLKDWAAAGPDVSGRCTQEMTGSAIDSADNSE